MWHEFDVVNDVNWITTRHQLEEVILESVVGWESYKTTPGSWQREEDLSGRIFPNSSVTQLADVHLEEEELDTLVGSWKCGTTYQQD